MLGRFWKVPKAPIGLYLVAMVVTFALPLLVFVVIILSRLEMSERVTLDRRTERDAQALSTSVGRQLRDMAVTLRILATAPELAAGDLDLFHERTQSALRSASYFLLVLDRQGRQLLNTRVPYGTPLGQTTSMASVQSVLQSGRIEVSDVFIGATGDRWEFNVAMPLTEAESSGAAVLILTQNAEEIARAVDTRGLPLDWSATLIDASGHVVASSEGTPAGELFPTDLLARITGSSGVMERDVEGEGVRLIGYAQVSGWPWRAVVAGPLSTAQETIGSTWQILIVGGLAFFGIAVASAYLLARRLRNAIEEIANLARRVGQGEIVAPVNSAVVEADMVAFALSEASFDRRQAEDRLHYVVRELAHRTKNQLSIVQAMIRQTARQAETLEEFQARATDRLQGMARSIDLLTAVEWAGVSVTTLVRNQLETFVDAGQRLEITGKDFPVKPDAVQGLGMALHELATNAVKYGSLSVPHGEVHVDWSETADDTDEPVLVFAWREVGGPKVAAPSRKGFGTMIIESHLATSFRASVDLDYARDGLCVTLKAPASALRQDVPAPVRSQD